MAQAKLSPKRLGCKIKDIKPDHLHPGRMIISVEFDDGNKDLGPWHQAFSVIPDQVITVDDFLKHLYTMPIGRPKDPYENLKKAMELGDTFVINLTAKIEPATEDK